MDTVCAQEGASSIDLLYGAAPVAKFLFGDDPAGVRRVYYLSSEVGAAARPPLFKIGNVICARRSTLLTWIAEREGRAAA